MAQSADLLCLQSAGHNEAVRWLRSLQGSLHAATKGQHADGAQPQMSPALVLMLTSLLSHPATSVQVPLCPAFFCLSHWLVLINLLVGHAAAPSCIV